jgi:hypothetical protein
MTAFKNSPYGNGEYSGRLTNIETRTLMKHAGCEFAMRWNRGGCADFVTWRLDRNGEREIGHYFDDYAEAKEDFAVRAGLLDRSKLFTETELAVLRSSLSDYLSLDGNSLTYGNEETVRGVIGKIDAVIAPEIEEQANEAEDQGYEPEMDL